MDTKQTYQQAIVHHRKGELAPAEECCRLILRNEPDNAKALHMLGFIAWQKKNNEEAVSLIRKAIALSPNTESFHNNLGNVLKDMGRKEEALSCYRESIRLNPSYAGGYMNLGAVLQDLGRITEAIQAFETYLGFQPDDNRIRSIACTLLRRQKQYDRAMRHCRKILQISPGLAWARNELGGLYFLTGFPDQAEASYRKALEGEPRNPHFLSNLALVLTEKRRPKEALALLEKAQEIEPGHESSAIHLSRLRLGCCLWEHRAEDIRTILDFNKRRLMGPGREELEPWTLCQIPVERNFQIQVAREKARFYEEQMGQARIAATQAVPTERPARLKVGYVSPDFRNHAVGLLIHNMFRFHDRNRFEVFCYSLTRFPGDAFQQAVRDGADHFVELADRSSAEAARIMRDDGIHILVDLAGYTNFSKPEIFALRPAPVQAQYLGYLDTMAADFINYTIADHIVIDPESAREYSEKIVYMPHTFAVCSGFPAAGRLVLRSEYGLPENGIVFCCFNTSYKIDPEVFGSWMRVLSGVPGSVLWLLSSSDDLLSDNLRKEAGTLGMDPARLVFSGWASVEDHSARLALADLFLDTFIYNAGTTAVQALCAGVPVLTLKGSTFLRRMGASLCTAAGLPELVCGSRGEYEEKAVNLARHPAALKDYRNRLLSPDNPPPLFDTSTFVADLERAYDRMWEHTLRGARKDIDLAASE